MREVNLSELPRGKTEDPGLARRRPRQQPNRPCRLMVWRHIIRDRMARGVGPEFELRDGRRQLEPGPPGSSPASRPAATAPMPASSSPTSPTTAADPSTGTSIAGAGRRKTTSRAGTPPPRRPHVVSRGYVQPVPAVPARRCVLAAGETADTDAPMFAGGRSVRRAASPSEPLSAPSQPGCGSSDVGACSTPLPSDKSGGRRRVIRFRLRCDEFACTFVAIRQFVGSRNRVSVLSPSAPM